MKGVVDLCMAVHREQHSSLGVDTILTLTVLKSRFITSIAVGTTTLTDRRDDSSHHITNPSLAATTCYPMTNSPGFSRRGQWRGCLHLVGRLPAGGASDVTVTPPGHPYVSSVLETLRSLTSSFMPPLRLLRGPRIRAIRVTHSRLCNTHARPRAPVHSERADS